MNTAQFDLQARHHPSTVLSAWLADRPGAAQRAGVQINSAGQNSVTTNLSYEQLASTLGLANASAAGITVTADSALRVATVYACVSLLAGAIATLPFAVFERDGDTRARVRHDYWWMLNEQANDDMTSASAWEYLISAKLFHGDGFARLLRPGFSSAKVIGWEPLHPMRV